ncbi:nose resistant to fluoxetine protein 6-like [Drosophila eugracilis]|uniref:nose resistant to fluoxetine protein 6-like n=1 Tax=Drosophila eugracilis TaxID=29029 RepID=UPI001BD9D1FC|nr:nose resistant to fluoxetine protein 6-like [Drosophila eugracilis]
MAKVVTIIFFCGVVLVAAADPKDIGLLKQFQRLKQLRPLGIEFAEHYQNVSGKDLDFNFDTALPREGESMCLADMLLLMQSLSAGNYWAMKMIDSWGSIPSGLLYGNFYDLGNYDECLNINKQISSSHSIQGKYCFLSASLGGVLGIPALDVKPVNIATCFPASCSAAQMEGLVGKLFQQFFGLNSSLSINEATCQTIDGKPWDGLTIFTVVTISLMFSVVTFFTLYDYFLCKNQDELSPLVKAFSARSNSRVLFRIAESKSNPNVIECLHGIRCMSIIWVVYSHVNLYFSTMPNINLAHVYTWVEKPFSNIILHGVFSVDSFFFLGGLLVAMIALRSMDKTKGKLNAPLMYLHRLVRILPVLGMAILIYMKLMPLVSGGPLFYSGYSETKSCEKGWFWTLLFIQNYATTDICLSHSWYLAVDMQLYIISPILLVALYKWGKKAAAVIVLLIVLLSGCLFATMMINHYTFLIKKKSGNDMANHRLYQSTHRHAAPWLIGFLFGYFLHLNRGKKFQLNRLTVWSGWSMCLALFGTSLFALYPASKWGAPALSTLEESLYYTLTRLAWPIALCWIVFACMQGYGGLANSFLSSPLWQPLSRLSYSVYIWHMFIVEVNCKNVRTSTYFSDYTAMLKFWSDFGFTVIMSYVFYLIIEGPLAGFDSLLKTKNKPSVDNVRASSSTKKTTE